MDLGKAKRLFSYGYGGDCTPNPYPQHGRYCPSTEWGSGYPPVAYPSTGYSCSSDSESEDEELDCSYECIYELGTQTGPNKFGSISESWKLPVTGLMQSPINILSNNAVLCPSSWSLRTYYQQAQATLTNLGRGVQVKWADGNAGGIMINGDVYTLQQGHWHTPSEHTLDDKRYELELHLVHTNTRGDIAVIGVLYKLGATDPFLAQLVPYLQSVRTPQQQVNVGYVNPDDTRLDTRSYYRYTGSLTTPPYTENVSWTVIRKVKTVSQAQIIALQNVADKKEQENARPVQKLNGRLVVLYRQ